MEQSAMRFGDIKERFEKIGVIGEFYKVLTEGIMENIISQFPARNNHAEFVKAKYIKAGVLREENCNPSVPYVCRNCMIENCEPLNSTRSALFAVCPYKSKE